MAKERWASRVGLVLAMAGNAVGLGNFLRFPAQAVKNGGGAFLIPYIVALLVMGLPLVWVEWTMGRYGGQKGHHSTPGIFQSMGRSPLWKYFGAIGPWTCLIIASYYLYIESWTMAYAGYSLWGGFSQTDPKVFFDSLTGQSENSIVAISGWGLAIFAACLALNIYILSRGLVKGIELVSKIGMPLLIVFAMVLAVRGLLIVPGAGPHAEESKWVDADPKAVESPLVGLNYVWEPRYDSLTNPAVWLAAAGQIFFTLSIGMGSIHCFASYLREKDDVALTGALAAWTNEFCEVILGGSILIPIAVAYYGLPKVQELIATTSGLDLGFKVFPTLFQNWGRLAPAAGFLWFGLLFFAAITSSLAMGQPIMAFLQTEFNFSRSKSALAFGGMLLPLAGCVACLHGSSFFDEFDYWGGTFGLVVFALGEAVLFAWIFGMKRGWEELNQGADLRVPRVFFYVIKYITPTFLFVILLAYIFQPKAGWESYASGIAHGESMPAWEWSGDGMIGKLLHKDLPITPGMPTEKQEFLERVRTFRLLDRGVMIGVFVFLCVLVRLAWQRRAARGEIPT